MPELALISQTRRLRRTPFSEGVEAAGVSAYTVYNRMMLPTVFRSVQEDYHHLKSAVQVWDVACERQVELRGPDAAKLMQMLTPRDLRGMLPGRCFYIPIVDETGGSPLRTVICCSGSRGSPMATASTCWWTSRTSARWVCKAPRQTR
jgi:glycine cleavage system aminomethyltransferase T